MATMAVPARKESYQNTTIRMPKKVYERARTVVLKHENISSLNEFVVEAVQDKLKELEEAEIDAAFAEMANDADYQRDAVKMAREFQLSDWEAFNVAPKAVDEQHTNETNNPKAATR